MEKNFDRVKDSGERQDFGTGSVRDTNEGKGRFDLIPPYAMFRLARHFQNGAIKYKENNWAEGQGLKRYFDSAERHLNKVKMGLKDEDHLIAAAWNILCLVETQKLIEVGKLPKELDDLYSFYEGFEDEILNELEGSTASELKKKKASPKKKIKKKATKKLAKRTVKKFFTMSDKKTAKKAKKKTAKKPVKKTMTKIGM